ncbi:MAG: siderophore-interacting protein [Kiloniellaceae bacterium]
MDGLASGAPDARHQITRVRHETRRRTLTLVTKEALTPRMLRLGFRSDDLHDFVSAAPDDHVKLFFPLAQGAGEGPGEGPGKGSEDARPVMRDFTPRAFDPALGSLIIDVALHDAGPAVEWAVAAQVGDRLEIGGPRGSAVVTDDFDWYLLIGDETALPAIGRRVEELRPGVPVATFAVVDGEDEIQQFKTQAAWRPTWVPRKASLNDATLLRGALNDYALPPGDGFVWIAAEADVARDLRRLIVEERGHPRAWTKAAGYWQRGVANANMRLED